MSKRKITLKQFCKLWIDGTSLVIVQEGYGWFTVRVDDLHGYKEADWFVDHCYCYGNSIYVVITEK